MTDTLGGRIAEARKSAGRTQEWLGEQTDSNRGSVINWEKPDGNPSSKNLQKIIGALGVSGHWLITGEGTMRDTPHQNAQTLGRMQAVMRDHLSATQDPQDQNVGTCLLDTDLRFVEVNEWLAAVNGLPVSEHIGEKITDISPHIADGVVGQLQSVLDTGELIINGLAKVPDGPTYRHDYYALRAPDNSVIGVRCIVREIPSTVTAPDAERLRNLGRVRHLATDTPGKKKKGGR